MAFFDHFRLSEGYTYLSTAIVKPFLQPFGGVDQLYTTGGLQDKEDYTTLSL